MDQEVEHLRKKLALLENVVEKMGYILAAHLPASAMDALDKLGTDWTDHVNQLNKEHGKIMDVLSTVMNWNKDAGNTAGEINVRQSALYLGLQCEELAEKLSAVGFMALAQILDKAATNFKTGEYDYAVNNCLATKEGRKEMLDGDLDLIVVSIGAAMSQGAQVHAAMAEVLASNDSKRTDGKLLKDANGKIMKGPDYFVADLLQFVKPDPETNDATRTED